MKDNLPLDYSKLRRYSLGIVLEDNIDNDFEIKVFPLERLYNVGGDLNKDLIQKSTIVNKVLKLVPKVDEPEYEDNKEIIEIIKTNHVFATWLNSKQSNRLTPPNVGRGEKVIIYRFSNKDEYYWETEETDLKLRKEEHVIYSYSDKPNLDDEEDEINDRYTITVSPKEKKISLHTTDKYGEYTTYDITLDTGNGNFELLDGKKNRIFLDSTTDTLSIHMEGKKAQYDATLAGDDGFIVINDQKDNKIELDTNASKLTININNDIEFNAKKYVINCDNYIVNSKTHTIETTDYVLNSTNNTITSSGTDYKGGYIKHDGISMDKTEISYGNLGKPTSPPIN